MDNLIGQRFSLISKSEIRYVGTLHEINPEQSTIALEDVLSFGTEDRRVTNFIPPSPQRFEYIVFRGSDVKDIKQAEDVPEPKQPSQPPNDPAILNSSRPGPTQPAQGPPSNHGESPFPPNYPPQAYGGFYPPPPPPPPPGQFGRGYGPPPGNFGPPYGPPPGYFGPPPGPGFPQGPNRFQPPPPPPPPPIGPPGSRPPPPNEQPPAPSQGPAAKQTPELPVEKNASRNGSKPSTPAPPSVPAAQAPPATQPPPAAPKVHTAQQKSNKVTPAMPFTVNQKSFVPPPSSETPPQSQPAAKPAPSQLEMDEASRQAREAVAAATAKIAAQGASAPKPAGQPTATVESITERVSQLSAGPAAGRGRGNYRGGRGGRASSGGQRQKMEIPQSDFDFASANAKFNKEDLVKEAIASGSPRTEASEEQVNDTQPARRDSLQNPPAPAYNKASSFFDNISSEARDREEAREINPRALRGQEFKKNIETFGQGNVDNYRGRGRGRGGYRGWGRGGIYRGRGGRQNADAVQN